MPVLSFYEEDAVSEKAIKSGCLQLESVVMFVNSYTKIHSELFSCLNIIWNDLFYFELRTTQVQ